MGRIITRHDGKLFHVGGRLVPKVAHRFRLHDSRYGLDLSKWPVTPTLTTYGSAPSAQSVLTDVCGNDSVGDCTEANSYHLQALRQAASGSPVFHPTLDEVLATYSRDGGYVVGDPNTDQGCDEVTVLTNAKDFGITSGSTTNGIVVVDKLLGFVAVDATNRNLVRACVSMFVGGSICMGLPDAWLDPFPSSPGWTWGVPSGGFVANPSNGHCFTLGDQNDKNLSCWSWAMPFTLTYDALAAGAVESGGGMLYFLLDAEILQQAAAQAPDGLDWACLQADFSSVPAVS